jgi:hypothetical protein
LPAPLAGLDVRHFAGLTLDQGLDGLAPGGGLLVDLGQRGFRLLSQIALGELAGDVRLDRLTDLVSDRGLAILADSQANP